MTTFPTMLRFLAIAVIGLLFLGCSKPYGTQRDASEEESEDQGEVYSEAPSAKSYGAVSLSRDEAPRSKKRSAGRSMQASLAAPPAPAEAPAPTPTPDAAASQTPARTKRMVHYSGRATLRSTEPEKVLDSAIAIVKAEGGYMEQRSTGFAALRVPAEKFDSLFYRLMRLGEVVDFSQEAEDITEAFQDTELRLKVVAATLERLEDLIKKAKTESQKLRLLREMKRLREEKEVLDGQRKELVRRARFASIHLWLQGHTPLVAGELWRQDIADFLWIHKLNPFDDARFEGRATVKFETPAGLVVSRKKKPWRATSSQGSEFWGSEREVEPIGDSRFWMEAVKVRLKDGFKVTETHEVGSFRFCRFQSFGPTPYFYWVGIRSREDEIDLAEFYFPTEAEQAVHLQALLASVEKAGK